MHREDRTMGRDNLHVVLLHHTAQQPLGGKVRLDTAAVHIKKIIGHCR